MAELTEGQIELARSLYDVGAVKLQQDGEEGFRMKIHDTEPDRPLSPIFLQIRTKEHSSHGEGPLTENEVNQIGAELYELLERVGVEYDHVAGIPEAAVPFADAFVDVSETRGEGDSKLIMHKKGDVADGSRHITDQVDGDYDPGESALLIDDLITHATTKLEAAAALRNNGLRVDALAVVVDREQGGVRQMEDTGVETHAVFTLTQLLDLYLDEERITPEMRQKIDDYLRADSQ
jgi:orotate phosphoribosyltransferase